MVLTQETTQRKSEIMGGKVEGLLKYLLLISKLLRYLHSVSFAKSDKATQSYFCNPDYRYCNTNCPP